MKKDLCDEAVGLTLEGLHRYWQHDYEYVLSLCTDDVMWIGSVASQFMRGIDAVREDFRRVDREIVSCHLSHEDFQIVHNTRDSISVAGRYLVSTDEGTGEALQVMQRCLFIWVRRDVGLRIACMYVSNPMGELTLDDDEMFPNYLGTTSWNYLRDQVNEATGVGMVSIRDKAGVTHYLRPADVICAESVVNDVVVYLRDYSIRARMTLTGLEALFGGGLIRVHRGFLVNPRYVRQLMPKGVRLANDVVIPINAKRRRELGDLLDRLLCGDGESVD